jgi:hypothetical protein
MGDTSFPDRLGRGRLMHAAIAGFDPQFAPADAALKAGAFNSALNDLETLNSETDDLVDQYKTGVRERTAIIVDLRDRAGRVLSFVVSNKAWSKHLPAVKSVVEKIRGNRAVTIKPPTGAETAEETKKRKSGARSFTEMTAHLVRLIAAVKKISGYAPPAAELTIAQLQALHAALHARNLAMVDLDQETGMKQRERFNAYNGPDGLKENMKAIKAAVRAQYGGASPEYAAVKGIGL